MSDKTGNTFKPEQAIISSTDDAIAVVAVLEERLKARECELVGLRRELEEKQTELIGKEQRLRSIQQQLNLLNSSLSWRITAPLRKLSDFVAKHTGVRVASQHRQDNDVVYPEWIRLYDTLTENERNRIRCHIGCLNFRPLISVVMPVYNAPERWLRKAIESVQSQLYPDWELCVADDASTDPAVRAVLDDYRQKDPRIKVTYREKNGHISAASNSALALAKGEFIALLDHDDELSEHALYLVAVELNRNAELDLLYSDEDKINEEGVRFHPFFKPGWSPDLFFSQNYLSHLGVYRTSLVRQVGGFREGYEGSQDYDLCLRVVSATTSERICHIPWVLYHWRAIEGSTAVSTKEKTYAEKAAESALKSYLQTIDTKIEVCAGVHPTTYIVKYPLPDVLPLVSLIIPSRDAYKVLKRCIETIRTKTSYPNYEIIIVDNQSVDPAAVKYLKRLERDSRVWVLRYDAPFNFSAINNSAVREARGTIVGLLNNDLEVISPDWLTEMVRHAVRPEIGAVGAKLYFPNGLVQHSGVLLGVGGIAGHAHLAFPRDSVGHWGHLVVVRNYSAVTAACLVVRKQLYEQVGGLDEVNLRIAYNDVDFCLRLKEAGYRNIWTPFAELFHHESFSRGYEDSPEKQKRLARESDYMAHRWGKLLDDDPFYNPNLTLDWPDYTLAWPPRVEWPWRACSTPACPEGTEEGFHAAIS